MANNNKNFTLKDVFNIFKDKAALIQEMKYLRNTLSNNLSEKCWLQHKIKQLVKMINEHDPKLKEFVDTLQNEVNSQEKNDVKS